MSAAPAASDTGAAGLRRFVFALFFIFGGITSLNDVVIPKLKALFTLSYAEAMLVQSAFFAAYFLCSLPAAAIVRHLGYLRTAALGLVTMTLGCLLFVPASSFGLFLPFLLALFVLAAGVTVVQVVANPLISLLGAASTAASRLTFAQAFNSLGTTVFPYLGSLLILGSLAAADPSPRRATQVIVRTYLGLSAVLLVVTAAVWAQRRRLREEPLATVPLRRAFGLLARPRFGLGTLGIFLYVGAEVSIGSILVIFLIRPDVLGLADRAAGQHVSLYWGGAMLGRFVGAWLLRRVAPARVLLAAAAGAIGLLSVAGLASGAVSGWALLAIGLCNSIMFPTLFSLASEGLGARAAEGSGLICMAIVGGAIVPLVTGHTADLLGLRAALSVPALCYVGIGAFARYARRPVLPVTA
jgi:FHS family L-fucose permease-like MFS transporter